MKNKIIQREEFNVKEKPTLYNRKESDNIE